MSEKRPQDITSGERVIRVNTVRQLLIQGASRQQIIQYCKGLMEGNDEDVICTNCGWSYCYRYYCDKLNRCKR